MTYVRVFFATCLISGCIEVAGLRHNAWAQGAAADQSSEDMWELDQDALRLLMNMRATNGEAHAALNRGDQIPDDYPVQDMPMFILERLAQPNNPYSSLQLQFYAAKGQIGLLLPLSRRVVKVYDLRAPAGPVVSAGGSVEPPATSPTPRRLASAPAQPTESPPSPPPQAQPQAPAVPDQAREVATSVSPNASPGSPSHGSGRDEIDAFMKRAEENRQRGDIMVMRLFLERAASLGSQEATYRLGETYDARMLNSWGARGVKADQARASKLYQQSGMDRAHAEAASARQQRP
jgi:outer membrane murein-binding lipoprotein Lpp